MMPPRKLKTYSSREGRVKSNSILIQVIENIGQLSQAYGSKSTKGPEALNMDGKLFTYQVVLQNE